MPLHCRSQYFCLEGKDCCRTHLAYAGRRFYYLLLCTLSVKLQLQVRYCVSLQQDGCSCTLTYNYLCCRRYEKAQKPLSAFDADISKYADLSEEVLAENAAESIKFLFVDCGPLKQVMLSLQMCHCFLCKCVTFLQKPPGICSYPSWGMDDP